MRGVALGVAAVVATLYLVGLGWAPFIDPPEGVHAEIARGMAASGDWITPRVNGVRYFDKPPLLYWLMAGSFSLAGPTPVAARVWSVVGAVGCAVATTWLGILLRGGRLGFLAGLMVATNLGVFLYGRLVKPDLVFVLCITLAWTGFAIAHLGRGRWGLAIFYGCLGLAAITKDVLGAVGPLAVMALFLWLVRERPLAQWFPWWGAVLAIAVAVPWYLAVEASNRGFLWYTVVDNHLLNFTRQRVFPDEDVPLGALEFVGVTVAGFLPWALAVPFGAARVLRRPWVDARDRLWVVFALWAIAVIGLCTVSPFKLPHYGLPAFPALALLAARAWDDAIDAVPGSPTARALLVPMLVVLALAAIALGTVAAGVASAPTAALSTVDVATRNVTTRGGTPPGAPLTVWEPVMLQAATVLAVAAGAIAVAVWRRSAPLGLGVALAAMIAFLPIAGQGMAQFARARSARPVVEALTLRARPGDVIVHEGPLENSGSALITLQRPVQVVNGLQSSLAFGATFPEARAVFWDAARFREEWTAPGRRFLVSVVAPDRSVVRMLPARAVHLIAHAGGRWLYANVAD